MDKMTELVQILREYKCWYSLTDEEVIELALSEYIRYSSPYAQCGVTPLPVVEFVDLSSIDDESIYGDIG